MALLERLAQPALLETLEPWQRRELVCLVRHAYNLGARSAHPQDASDAREPSRASSGRDAPAAQRPDRPEDQDG